MRPSADHAAAPSGPDESDVVVLLDEDGNPRGTAPRASVHTTSTPLHLAFSLYVVDEAGRLLLTRRALGKRAWPGVWSNSCCGHPRPGEAPAVAARRRVAEELGLEVADPLLVLPDFRYRAVDASGVVEHEVCPVHVAVVPDGTVPLPDPDEVAEHAWLAWPQVRRLVREAPFLLSPWMVLQVEELGAAVGDDLRHAGASAAGGVR